MVLVELLVVSPPSLLLYAASPDAADSLVPKADLPGAQPAPDLVMTPSSSSTSSSSSPSSSSTTGALGPVIVLVVFPEMMPSFSAPEGVALGLPASVVTAASVDHIVGLSVVVPPHHGQQTPAL